MATRGSSAESKNVWVPPPDSPVHAIRAGSTSGKVAIQSSVRRLFQVCNVARFRPQHRADRSRTRDQRLRSRPYPPCRRETPRNRAWPDGCILLEHRMNAPFFPVSMRTQDRGHSATVSDGPVEISARNMPGGFQSDSFDRVPLAINLAEDFRVERRLGRHRKEAESHFELRTQLGGPDIPHVGIGWCLKVDAFVIRANVCLRESSTVRCSRSARESS